MLDGCWMSQQHGSVSHGCICSDNCVCCHNEIELADQTFHLTQSQYTDTGPTSPRADPVMPGTWQGSHWCAKFKVIGMTHWTNLESITIISQLLSWLYYRTGSLPSGQNLVTCFITSVLYWVLFLHTCLFCTYQWWFLSANDLTVKLLSMRHTVHVWL